MVREDDEVNLTRYQAFVESEPLLTHIYQSRRDIIPKVNGTSQNDDDDDDDPADLAERERFVIQSTGAVLSYENSNNLLNFLCSLIPCDGFTPVHIPKYTGTFESTLRLPSSLPLPPSDLVYTGPTKHSKKEARRAVAFLAVKALYALNVFDDHLLPVSGRKMKYDADADGCPISDISDVPATMDVLVRDPWTLGQKLWLHPVSLDGCCNAGIVTGVMIPHMDMVFHSSLVRIHEGRPLILNQDQESIQREKFQEFMTRGVWYCNTTRPLPAPPGFYLIPLGADCQPDFDAIDRLVEHPHGNRDWSDIGESDCDHLLLMNANEHSRPLLLRRIRTDLSPMSKPVPDSPAAAFPTYLEYFVDKWTGRKWEARVPADGPLIEVQRIARCSSGEYALNGPPTPGAHVSVDADTFLVPQGSCYWVPLSEDMRRVFYLLPALCHRITDLYRARQARIELGLPPITDDLLVEAFTLPSANSGFSNQRLETLGDSVLKLCTTVHLYNKYPHRHEGQLTPMRQACISNNTLLSRAKDIGLEHFLTSEGQSVLSWRYIEAHGNQSTKARTMRYVPRQFARRSLQDCMESTLGASFLAGGIPMALQAGSALRLAFGGPHPWPLRYRLPEPSPAPALFEALQERLGYTFRCSSLLVEAVTHPSFTVSSLDPSYQRLEFLGDGEPDSL